MPVGCALAGLLGGVAYGLFAPAEYTATGQVVLTPVDGQDPDTTLGFARVYSRIASSGAVVDRAAAAFSLELEDVRGHVRASASPDAPVIEVTGTASGPAAAADVTNAVLRALVAQGNETTAATRAELSLLSPAHPPASATTPGPVVCGAVGLCVGGFAGGLLLLARGGRRVSDGPPDPS